MSELMVSAPLMPMDIGTAVTRYNHLVEFTQRIMKAGTDYGAVPGTSKPTLLKPGAEKLSTFFGLSPRYEIVKQVEQWDADEPFFYYWFKCSLYHGDRYVGSADGSCNSREARYRWRWVNWHDVPPGIDKGTLKTRGGKVTEPKFAVERGQTQGKYGKPESYWQTFRSAIEAGNAREVTRTSRDGRAMPSWEIEARSYRVPNEDIFSQVNTILKMAQKRALVAAVLVCVNASEFFTQDLEDLDIIDVPVTVVETKPVEAEPKAPPANAADIDERAELAEAKREAESVQPEPMTGPQAARELGFEGGIAAEVNLDWIPEGIDDWGGGMWTALRGMAVKKLGYSHDKHVKNTLKQIVPENDKGKLSYRAAWHLLQEHQRSKESKPV